MFNRDKTLSIGQFKFKKKKLILKVRSHSEPFRVQKQRWQQLDGVLFCGTIHIWWCKTPKKNCIFLHLKIVSALMILSLVKQRGKGTMFEMLHLANRWSWLNMPCSKHQQHWCRQWWRKHKRKLPQNLFLRYQKLHRKKEFRYIPQDHVMVYSRSNSRFQAHKMICRMLIS